MQVQLSWDGVVYPVEQLTFRGVFETAQRFNGLDLEGNDFSVFYKDEEGEAIMVKNEVDMAEALRWAEDQGNPLCLNIPFESNCSDDEEWDVISNGSQKGSSPKSKLSSGFKPQSLDLDAAESGFQSNLRGDEIPEVSSVLSAKSGVQLNLNPHSSVKDDEMAEASSELSDAASEPCVEVSSSLPEDVSGDVERQEHAEEPVEEQALVFEEDQTEQHVEQRVVDVGVEAVCPTDDVYGEDHAFVGEEENHDVEISHITDFAVPIVHVTEPSYNERAQLVEKIVASSFPPTEQSMQESLLKLMANPESLKQVCLMLQRPDIQDALSSICQSEVDLPGTASQTAKTQVISRPFVKEIVQLVNNAPGFETILSNLFKKQEPMKGKLVHTNVWCDGCEDNVDNAQASVKLGFRSASKEIVGSRYKSAVRPDYDLCEACEATGAFQESSGPFLKIVDPSTAPEFILCALPGATAGMMSQLDSLDWRNPIAKEFLEFVQIRQQRAFPQQRQLFPVEPPRVQAAPVQEAPSEDFEEVPVARSQPISTFVAPTNTPQCKHLLKTFETTHGGFNCNICLVKQPINSILHGCRPCNYDVCQSCHTRLGLPLPVPSVGAPPQAKFVADVTLADGSVVRPGEHLNKTWRVRNTGPEKWEKGTRIVHVGGDAFGGPLNGAEVPLAAPGEAVNVSVALVMPTVPGRYTSYWRMKTPHPTNARFGHRFWITCVVVPVGPPAPVRNPGVIVGSPRLSVPPPPPPRPVLDGPVLDESGQFEMAVSQITEFGFTDIDKIIQILREVNGDAGQAIDRLLAE
jgi:hypothetical protein